jgi:hypothetical protein
MRDQIFDVVLLVHAQPDLATYLKLKPHCRHFRRKTSAHVGATLIEEIDVFAVVGDC